MGFKNLSFWDMDGGIIFSILAVIGTAINSFIGGFDIMVQTLVSFMLADFVFGFLAAGKHKKIDSQVMFWGGVNKVLVLIMVGLGVLLDGVLGMQDPYIRTAIIWFYLGREGLSVGENLGKLGLPLPNAVIEIFEQLRKKDGE